ncbi:MAG TPA: AI-2E family transporter [Burkholderiales bacterium]|nr:AI-2E family transporter [Burkholderiales bacterium]
MELGLWLAPSAGLTEPRRTIDIAPAAIARIIAAIVVVWLWLRLWRLLMVILVAVVLAIALDTIVEWLKARRIPRGLGATVSVFGLTLLIVGFFWVSGASLMGQTRLLTDRLTTAEQDVIRHAPEPIARILRRNSTQQTSASAVAGYVVDVGRIAIVGALVAALAMILTIYLLIEGRRTYAWLVAYVPRAHRDRMHLTACEARKAILGYVAGNVATSVFAFVFVLVVLTVLHVPGALLLAILAGLFDFVPVLGFIGSAFPAVLLALTVSTPVALIVLALYAGYHLLENYYIGPRVYGDRLRLSNLAVIVAFAIGAEIGGVVGALLALPLAAMYPVVERVWLKNYLGRDAVETHRRLERRASGSG